MSVNDYDSESYWDAAGEPDLDDMDPLPMADAAWLVPYLQDRRRDALRAIRACPDSTADYWRWQGHAELARQLLQRLGAEVPS